MSFAVQASAPFTHAPTSVRRVMGLVIAALVPATLFDIYLFGWPALWLFLVTVGAALASEAVCLMMAGRPLEQPMTDGSAVLTGWLLAMSLPPWAPWWIGAVGGFIAVVIGKHVFGGLGQNPFNPAMVGRVALLISFPVPMTLFVAPRPLLSGQAPSFMESLRITFGGGFDIDTMSAASALGHIKTELSRGIPVDQSLAQAPDIMALAMGNVAGSLGETSALLILLGGLFLIYKKIISWHIPVALIGTIFALATLTHWADPGRYADGLFHVVSGATLLGAFFIATDLVTSPVTKQGQILYGIGIGAITFAIRAFAGYPEGMAFAVLLMNALTPLIDRWMRPRIFGRTRVGEPIQPNLPKGNQ